MQTTFFTTSESVFRSICLFLPARMLMWLLALIRTELKTLLFALSHQPLSMRWKQKIAAYTLIHPTVVRAFSQCSSVLQRGATGRRGIVPTMMSSQSELSGRRVPLGLGSWRVESVVDNQEEPNSMFVFLFDDGSGKRGRGSSAGVPDFSPQSIGLPPFSH